MIGLCDQHPTASNRSNRLFVLLILAVAALAAAVVCNGAAQERRSAADDQNAVRLTSTLVEVPVVVSDASGKLVADMSQREFSIFEDGKRQELSVFANSVQPFTAVLVLDTSNSADDRLTAIQNAAAAFVHEIGVDDKLMVMSFDNEVRQLTEFTSDKREVEQAIKGTESGFGKLLYESLSRALEHLKNVRGRKAIILFSDGIDMKSIDASAESVTRLAQEIGAIIYVVSFDTRWWVEADARAHQTTESKKKLPFEVDGRIPLPPDYGGPDSTPTGMPKVRAPRIEVGAPTRPPVTIIDGSSKTRYGPAKARDEIDEALDNLYGAAERFMNSLTAATAGRVLRADTFESTRSAFASIAAELRTQYLLGYYIASSKADGKYHRIRVDASRKGAIVRARSGYRLDSK